MILSARGLTVKSGGLTVGSMEPTGIVVTLGVFVVITETGEGVI